MKIETIRLAFFVEHPCDGRPIPEMTRLMNSLTLTSETEKLKCELHAVKFQNKVLRHALTVALVFIVLLGGWILWRM